MFPLESLRHFVAVAEELHFGLAARRLHMTQPPLSQRIRQLEQALGLALFKRSTRSVELTAAGQVLLARARALLDAAEQAARDAAQADQGQAGSLRLGFTSSSAHRVLPPVLAQFVQRHPAVRLDLREGVSVSLADDLLAHRIDVALLRPMPGRDLAGLSARSVQREPLVLACPRDHPLAVLRAVPIERLRDEALVGFSVEHSPYFHQLLEQAFAAARIAPRWSVQSVLPTILALVEARLGVAVVPESAAVLREGQLAYRPLKGVSARLKADLLCVSRDGEDDPVARNFITCVRGASAKSPAPPPPGPGNTPGS